MLLARPHLDGRVKSSPKKGRFEEILGKIINDLSLCSTKRERGPNGNFFRPEGKTKRTEHGMSGEIWKKYAKGVPKKIKTRGS